MAKKGERLHERRGVSIPGIRTIYLSIYLSACAHSRISRMILMSAQSRVTGSKVWKMACTRIKLAFSMRLAEKALKKNELV